MNRKLILLTIFASMIIGQSNLWAEILEGNVTSINREPQIIDVQPDPVDGSGVGPKELEVSVPLKVELKGVSFFSDIQIGERIKMDVSHNVISGKLEAKIIEVLVQKPQLVQNSNSTKPSTEAESVDVPQVKVQF